MCNLETGMSQNAICLKKLSVPTYFATNGVTNISPKKSNYFSDIIKLGWIKFFLFQAHPHTTNYEYNHSIISYFEGNLAIIGISYLIQYKANIAHTTTNKKKNLS